MNSHFELNLSQSIHPVHAPRGVRYHPRIEPPARTPSPRGVHFPLEKGAIAFESRGILDDAAGHIEVDFTLDATPAGWPLIQAFGQYAPVVQLDGESILLRIYHHEACLLVRWQPDVNYHLRMSWDHRTGVTLALHAARGPKYRLTRAWQWQAFRQKYVIFAIGGMLAGRPVFTQWSGSFKGWIHRVAAAPTPLESPVSAADSPRSPLPRHRAVTLLDLHDPPIVDSPIRYNHIPDRLADLRKTRKAWKLDELLRPCRTELETFITLTHHIAHAWPHHHYWPWPRNEQRHIFWHPGHAMAKPIAEGEMGGMCGGYAHVMEEIFWSLGFDARRVQVHHHSAFEAWSNQYNKWIFCEASTNRDCNLFFDAAGVPLGARDLIERHARLDSDSAALDDVASGICQSNGSVTMTDRPLWRNNAFFAGIALGDPIRNQGNREHAWYFLPHDRTSFKNKPVVSDIPSRLARRIDDLFWSCQRVKVSLRWSIPGKTVRIDAEPFQAAHFQTFEQRIDEGAWKSCLAPLTWRLHPGVNDLAIRTRNRLGAAGHPWSIRLFRKP